MNTVLLATIAYFLEVTLLIRAVKGRFVSHLPLFYSYIAYVLVSGLVVLGIYYFQPGSYANAYWFRFMITLVAEFAVLAEIADHIFRPYSMIRQLGRFLVVSICGVFFFSYILPSLMQSCSYSITMLDFVKRASLTKAVIIIALLVAARHYRLPLGRNISGMMLGFSLFLAVNVADFTLAEELGAKLYSRTFGIVGPVSWILCTLVWVVALWRYEPVPSTGRRGLASTEEDSGSFGDQLGRYNTTLMRLLRR